MVCTKFFVACLITAMIAAAECAPAPIYGKNFNQMNTAMRMKYLKRRFMAAKRRLAKLNQQYRTTELPTTTTSYPTTRPEKQHRRKLYETVVGACGPVIENACTAIHDRCHASFLSKRSIPDVATINKVKRSIPWYSNVGRRRTKGMRRFHISCKLCERNCWPR